MRVRVGVFTDNGDGTVRDNLTGLIWLKNAICFNGRNWESALTDANTLASGSCGLTDGSMVGDWRLPNINELHSLVDLSQSSPALTSGHSFGGVASEDVYWSSTADADGPSNAWDVFMNVGEVASDGKDNFFHVWPVRRGL